MSKIRYYFDRLVCNIMSFLFPKRFRFPDNITDIDPYILKLSRCSKFRKEVAAEYCMTEKTFYRRLKKHGIKIPSGRIKSPDLIKIYNILGPPKLRQLG